MLTSETIPSCLGPDEFESYSDNADISLGNGNSWKAKYPDLDFLDLDGDPSFFERTSWASETLTEGLTGGDWT